MGEIRSYVEKESGTVGSIVGEEIGGRCRAQNDRWLLQVHTYTHLTHTCTHTLYTHKHPCMHTYTHTHVTRNFYRDPTHFQYIEYNNVVEAHGHGFRSTVVSGEHSHSKASAIIVLVLLRECSPLTTVDRV